MPSLPFILSGPIVRRSEAPRIIVWLATSKALPKDSKLVVREVQRLTSKTPIYSPPISSTTTTKTVRIGAALYVHLFEALSGGRSKSGGIGAAGFPAGKILAYDLVDGDGSSLLPPKLKQSISLDPYDRPTLLLQPVRRLQRNCIYLSCRKPHGEGEDAARAGLHVLESRARNVGLRPHALLLLGDQIYADDVADAWIEELTALGSQLVGVEEEVPEIGLASKLGVRGRQAPTERIAKLTSKEAGNHLLAFGEYAAMYILCWSPELWPKAFRPAGALSTRVPGSVRPGSAEFGAQIRGQVRKLEEAKKGSLAIRKLLANVPTYAIFDDHEITDDWNLNPKWTRRVEAKASGRRVLSNGLAAYWAFQAWGNDPSAFSDTNFLNPVKKHLDGLRSTRGRGHPASFERALLSQKWSFTAPGMPLSLFMDTRTRRSRRAARRLDWEGILPSIRSRRAPLLLDKSWPQELRKDLSTAGYRAGSPLITIAATPVFGLEGVEAMQNLAAWFGANEKFDWESWRANPRSFFNFAQQLLKLRPDPLILLSGDVHYGFAGGGELTHESSRVPFVQVTSSPTKNENGKSKERQLRFLARLDATPYRRSKTHWWGRGGWDGGIVSQDKEGVLDLLAYAVKRLFFGKPDLAEEATFRPQRGSHTSGRVRDLLQLENHVSTVEIRNRRIRARTYSQSRGGTVPGREQSWPPWL